MNYSPKLKQATKEIKAILKKHDIAGIVMLHTPGFSEYLYELTPSYSCLVIHDDKIGFKGARHPDYDGNMKLLEKHLQGTSNMLHSLPNVGFKMLMQLMEISKKLDKKIGAEHDPPKHTPHKEE